MPGSVTIKATVMADAPALALIGAASFLDGFAGVLDGRSIVRHCAAHHSLAAYEALFAAGAQAFLAIEPLGAPVGYALTTRPDIPGMMEGDVELKRIYLLSRYHGCGAATGLLDAAIAANRGAGRLILGVYEHNARALAFYARSGFVEVAKRQFNMGGTLFNDKVLALDLTSVSCGKAS